MQVRAFERYIPSKQPPFLQIGSWLEKQVSALIKKSLLYGIQILTHI